MNLSKVGKGKIKVKENGRLREKGLKMQRRKKIWHLKRSLIQLDRVMDHSNGIEVMVLDGWSVGHAVRNTLGEIVRRTRVVGLRHIVQKRCRLLGMLDRAFLVFMKRGQQTDRAPCIYH